MRLEFVRVNFADTSHTQMIVNLRQRPVCAVIAIGIDTVRDIVRLGVDGQLVLNTTLRGQVDGLQKRQMLSRVHGVQVLVRGLVGDAQFHDRGLKGSHCAKPTRCVQKMRWRVRQRHAWPLHDREPRHRAAVWVVLRPRATKPMGPRFRGWCR